MELDITDFGKKLKICRVMREWSQEACAAQLGVSIATWQNWERNRTKPFKYLQKEIKKIFPEIAQG